jgi:hypothetical protein
MTLRRVGRVDDAAAIERTLMESLPTSKLPALMAAERGDRTLALQRLRQSILAGGSFYLYNNPLLHEHPHFAALREDPAFREFVRPR